MSGNLKGEGRTVKITEGGPQLLKSAKFWGEENNKEPREGGCEQSGSLSTHINWECLFSSQPSLKWCSKV